MGRRRLVGCFNIPDDLPPVAPAVGGVWAVGGNERQEQQSTDGSDDVGQHGAHRLLVPDSRTSKECRCGALLPSWDGKQSCGATAHVYYRRGCRRLSRPGSNGSVCSTRRPHSVPLPCPSWHSCHPSIPCLDQWGCTGVANGGGSELCYAQIIVCGLNRWWVVRLMTISFLQQVNRIKCDGRHFVQNINYTRSLNIEVWSYKVTLLSPLPNRSPWPTSPFV